MKRKNKLIPDSLIESIFSTNFFNQSVNNRVFAEYKVKFIFYSFMRTLIILSFFLFAFSIAFAQTTPQKTLPSQKQGIPSQKEMQAQMQQAKNEAQQMILDLENQIAEAKKKGDDPGSIQELEKQLATMRKALGVVDKAANMNEIKPKAVADRSNTIAPYRSPFITIAVNQPIKAPTEAEAKDRLLWYRGRRLNDSMLVTPQSRVILYSRNRNMVIVKPDERRDSSMLKLINNLKQSRNWTNNLINNVAARKNSSFDYPLMMMTLKQFDLIERAYNKLVDNTIKLPSSFGSFRVDKNFLRTNNSGPSDGLEQPDETKFDPLVQMHSEMMTLLNNPPPLEDFPIPPTEEFDLCYYCDLTAQERYSQEADAWQEKFSEYEQKLLGYYNGIQHYCATVLNIENVAHPDIPSLKADIQRAYTLAFERLHQKNRILEHRYSNDVQRLTILMRCKLTLDRMLALMGDSGDASATMNFVPTVLNDFIRDQKNLKNYNVIFNYFFILGLDRQMALLGMSDDNFANSFMGQVVDFNRFTFTMDIEFNMVIKDAEDKETMRATGYLNTPQKTYVSLGRKDCKFQLYLYDPNYYVSMRDESQFEILLSITEGVKLVKEAENWKSYNYSGPSQMKTVFPSIRIDFCANGVQDSVLVDVIRFSDQDLASVTSADELAKKYTLDIQEYVNLVVASITKVEADRDAVLDITDDIIAMQSNTTTTPTGYAQLDKMQLEFTMLQRQLKIKEQITLKTKENPSVILFDAQNESSILINKSVNMAGERGFKIEMKSAVVKLKVEHAPL